MPLNQAEIQERLRQKFGDRSARTGGKGAFRRKYKAVTKTATQDDKRLNSQLKRLNITQIPAIEEVNLFKDDGNVVHFTKPKVQAEISSNTYVVQGNHATKKLEELFPDILPQLGGESIEKLKNLAQVLKQANLGAEEVPTLVNENFEEVAKRDEKVEENIEKPNTTTEKPLTESISTTEKPLTEEKKEQTSVVSGDNPLAATTSTHVPDAPSTHVPDAPSTHVPDAPSTHVPHVTTGDNNTKGPSTNSENKEPAPTV